MTYWKSKVLPKIKKYFGKGDANSKGAAEAAKSFNKAKNSIEKEIEEKKPELEPKIIEIYQDSKPETKLLFKEPTEDKVKQNAQAVQDLLQRLVEAGCPGAQILKEAGDKYGTALLSSQIQYLLGKLSPFVANEESPVIARELDLVEGGAETAEETAKDISEAPAVPEGDENVKETTETTAKVEKEVEIVGTEEKGHL